MSQRSSANHFKIPHSLSCSISMSLFKAVGELCDVVSLVVFCSSDNTMMLTLEAATNDYWIPSVKVPPGSRWNDTISKDIEEIFGKMNVNKILKMYKVWIPRHNALCLYHCIFQLNVDGEQKKKTKNTFGKYRGKIRWVTENELIKLMTSNNLKSPEVAELFYLLKNQDIGAFYVHPDEFIERGNFLEICEDILVQGKSTIYETIVDVSGIDRHAQESIYREFVLMCFPAVYMGLNIFSKFALELGWAKEDAAPLFRSADVNSRYGLTFREFVYFLAAVDPNTTHGAGPAELRCRYMFRYFDRDLDNLLKLEEFRNIVLATRKVRKAPIDAANVNKETSELYKSMGIAETHPLTVIEFLRGVGDLKIRGTSQLYRSAVSIVQYLKNVSEKESKIPQTKRNLPEVTKTGSNSSKPKATPPVNASIVGSKANIITKPKDYELAVHTVKIQRSGQAINVDQMTNLESAVSMTTLKQPINEYNRRISMDLFSQKSISNEVLKGLRYLTIVNKKQQQQGKSPAPPYSWGQLDANTFCRNLIAVCNQVREVFKAESRLLELKSPVYILGDLHGNIYDLLYFERLLWHIGPGLCPCNLLFLGDYVDRGPYSMEVIAYLFCYKLQSPRKLNLLRGNHEIREIQKMFTFFSECSLKFGEKLGNDFWTAVNNTFDAMPIAAVIDGKVFCCHGGIPPPWLCPVISAINDIPVPLSQPDTQSSLAWEIMWNDPVRSKTMDEKLAMELLANEGFAVNARRGTAHVFSVEALERFLKANQLTHLIRAHEVAAAGFAVQQKGKLLTVFSSSRYCGGANEAACVLADQGKLRILRLETE